MGRISLDELYLDMAELIAQRSTCARRQVGCVLTDHRGRVLSMGYNGVPSGQVHCTTTPCKGANYPSGQGLDFCQAIHAEQNAVVLLRDPTVVHTAYVTVSPCRSCIKLLFATSCKRIVCRSHYVHEEAIRDWKDSGREIIFLEGILKG
jgi:dCMP deaminase